MLEWRVGDVIIKRIEELQGPGFGAEQLFPQWTQESVRPYLHWLAPDYFEPETGRLITSIHSWLLQTPAHNILIDTCTGNHKERPWSPRFHKLDTPWLKRLGQAGIHPDEVDFVLCTHLHVDHVGWNTQLRDGRWVPTFPNARYVFSKKEHDFWSPEHNPNVVARHPGKELIYQDSVLPVLAAGMAQLCDGVEAIDDWVSVEPAPGHTPGHIIVKLDSAGHKAVFSGDILHHPIQVTYPDWNSRFCELQGEARATRRRVLEFCSEENAWLMPAHFAAPHAAKIECACDAFKVHFRVT